MPTGLTTVHPHVRGEYCAVHRKRLSVYGSSPRAWGIQGRAAETVRPFRFIPTCVGNTEDIKCPKKRISVHPHVRGEYKIKNDAMSDQDGSSPRAWGILAGEVVAKDIARFIPTCVGNTP